MPAKSNLQKPPEAIERERQEPAKMPQTLADFKNLSFRERQWLYDNRPSVYQKFKDLMEMGVRE